MYIFWLVLWLKADNKWMVLYPVVTFQNVFLRQKNNSCFKIFYLPSTSEERGEAKLAKSISDVNCMMGMRGLIILFSLILFENVL